MRRPSPVTRATSLAVLLTAAIVTTGAIRRGQSPEGPARLPDWSVHTDPLRLLPAKPSPDAPTRRILQTKSDWNWGELVVGRTYRGDITLTNACPTDQRVGLFISGLPDLLIQPTATVPAHGSVALPYRIVVTAPAGSGGVIRGELVAWFPSVADPACPAMRLVHDVSGRVRSATPQDEAAEKTTLERERIADACVRWWAFEEKPVDRTESECAPVIQRIAIRTRQRLERGTSAARVALTRVPNAQAIQRMSMTELIALRRDFAAALGAPR